MTVRNLFQELIAEQDAGANEELEGDAAATARCQSRDSSIQKKTEVMLFNIGEHSSLRTTRGAT